MKKFLAIYIGTALARERSKWNELPEARRKEREAAGMNAWMEWGRRHEGAIVDQGTPLGKTKRAAADGVTDVKNSMVGYVIVQAESHEAAARCSSSIRTSASSRATRSRSWSACRCRRCERLALSWLTSRV
jgi:hypothetical protein